MSRNISITFLALLLMQPLTGQDKNFKRIFLEGEYHTLAGEYTEAVKCYESLLSSDPENANLSFLCGYNYLKMGGHVERVISLLEKASESTSSSYRDGSYKERYAPADALFLLGRAYHIDRRFDKAMETYSRYRETIDEKEFAEIQYVSAHISACERGKSMVQDPVPVEFTPLGEPFDFDWDISNPVVSGDGATLVFLSRRNNRYDLMISAKEDNRWNKPLGINPQIGLTGEFRPVCLSYDGSELYLVYNDYYNMDLYVSRFENGRWTNAEKLNNHINTRYTESHACLSSDGTLLYFTSDRKGGPGGLDIYRSARSSGGQWGEPVLLGNQVNTYYNEDTPFLSRDDSRLYFSSQGHHTMGGYDFFYSERDSGGDYRQPVNLGYPLNTTGDDLFFNPGWHAGQSLIATTMNNGGSNRTICRVELPEDALLSASGSGSPEELRGAGGVESSGQAGTAGQAGVESSGQAGTAGGIHIGGRGESGSASVRIYYVLNNILFDYKEFILSPSGIRDAERIYVLMRKYPEIEVELTGHTDAIGSAEYNMWLSDQRARSVAGYLTSKGIDPSRITIRAAGESDPVAINRHADGSDAPEGRELNRHVSIKVTNLSSNPIRVAEIFVPDDLIPKEDKEYTIMLFQSTGRVALTPQEFLQQEVSMISTDDFYIYTAGNFNRKQEAIGYLNEVIDSGYPDARIMERRKLEELILANSASDPFSRQTYTIQVMALKKARDPSYFSVLNEVRRFDCKDGMHRYVTGEFTRIEEALRELPLLRRKGFRDAMIMPLSRYDELVAKN